MWILLTNQNSSSDTACPLQREANGSRGCGALRRWRSAPPGKTYMALKAEQADDGLIVNQHNMHPIHYRMLYKREMLVAKK